MAKADDENIQNLVDKAVADAQASIDDLKKVTGDEDSSADQPADAAKDAPQGASAGGGEAADQSVEAAKPVEVPDLTGQGQPSAQAVHREPVSGIELLSDVDVHVTIELGRTRMLVEDVLALASGSVVELDKLAGDPVDVFVNGRLVARGEVLVLNDNFCIRISEIVGDLEEQAEAAVSEEQERQRREQEQQQEAVATGASQVQQAGATSS